MLDTNDVRGKSGGKTERNRRELAEDKRKRMGIEPTVPLLA